MGEVHGRRPDPIGRPTQNDHVGGLGAPPVSTKDVRCRSCRIPRLPSTRRRSPPSRACAPRSWSNLDQQQRIPVAQLSPSPDCATCVMPLNVLENCIACNLAEHATVRISSTDPHQISGRLHRFRRVSMGCSAGDAGAPLNPFRI